MFEIAIGIILTILVLVYLFNAKKAPVVAPTAVPIAMPIAVPIAALPVDVPIAAPISAPTVAPIASPLPATIIPATSSTPTLSAPVSTAPIAWTRVPNYNYINGQVNPKMDSPDGNTKYLGTFDTVDKCEAACVADWCKHYTYVGAGGDTYANQCWGMTNISPKSAAAYGVFSGDRK